MTLSRLFEELCSILCDNDPIEANAIKALQMADTNIDLPGQSSPLSIPFLDVMSQDDAHPVCDLIREMPFHWAPPETSKDPLYKQHSSFKAHVELLGPSGLVSSSNIRLGLYGMLAQSEYGIRTHPAEETYIMLAGHAFWKRGDAPYEQLFSGQRSYHPSMMPHATRTGDAAFMSIYIWDGDISTENYKYLGLPED
jgi:hypothetical protein